MLVGVDFDNTIVCYDRVFHRAALEKGLIPADLPPSKGQVRDFMRSQGQEESWIALQGYVYGPMMREAESFPGALDFFNQCRTNKIRVRIISHRTQYPFSGPRYDLHQAARDWVEYNGFYERTGLSPEHVFFELRKQEKLDRIRQEGCSIFIDDLPEFLKELDSFSNLRRILFDPNEVYASENSFERATSWDQITRMVTRQVTGC